MTKYTVDHSDNANESTVCEICGSEENIREGFIQDTKTTLCETCYEKHGDEPNNDKNETSANNQKINDNNKENVGGYTITNPDPSWVEDVNYNDSKTPYLVPNYSEKVNEKITKDKTKQLLEETSLVKKDIDALTNGKAVSKNIPKEKIEIIESYLDITIQEEYNT